MEPVLHSSVAAWLGVSHFGEAPYFGAHVIVAAHGAALVRTNFGLFIVDRERGISRPHELGAFAAAAFGADGTLFVSRESGTLYRSRRRADGTWPLLDEVGRVPHPTQWRVGGKALFAFDKERFVRSSDDGATWTTTSIGHGVVIRNVFARSDEAIVVDGEDPTGRVTYVSIDRGNSFKRTVTVAHLAQLGDWIFGFDQCAPKIVWTVLASDGVSWVVVPHEPQPTWQARDRSVSAMFASSPRPGAQPHARRSRGPTI